MRLDEAALGPHALIEPVEHRVERIGQIAHLVGWAAEADPPREIGRLDLPRHAGDRAHGPQDAAGDSPTDREADRHQREECQEREIANRLEGLLADGLLHVQQGIGRARAPPPSSSARPMSRTRSSSSSSVVACCSGIVAATVSRARFMPSTSTPAVTSRAAVTIIASRKRTDRTSAASRRSGDRLTATPP